MNDSADPYAHHPELRGQIKNPLQSFFRTFTTADLGARMKEQGLPLNWWHSDEKREAMRAETLVDRRSSDLWVFGYGSLMWDPGICFSEVRRACIPNFARRFILKDIYGARGSRENPGLIAALDKGTGCEGLCFRIACNDIEEETEVLWRREQIGPAYKAVFVEAQMAERHVEALAFVADHDAETIDRHLSREQQIIYASTGAGIFGTSIDYLRSIQTKLTALGIYDEEVASLLRDSEAYLRSRRSFR